MYEADDGEYDAYESFELRPKSKNRKYFGIFLIVYSLISYGLAQTINLNGNNRVEFGQGIYTIKACDSFISVTLNPNATDLKSFTLSGLDTKACAGRNILFQIFTNGSAIPLPIFEEGTGVNVSRLLLNVASNANSPRATAISLINSAGTNVGVGDSYESLEFNSQSAEYTISFATPLATVNSVNSITVQTSAA